MTAPAARNPRRFSSRALAVMTPVIFLYALGLALLDPAVWSPLTSEAPVLCGRTHPAFATPGRLGWSHALQPQDATGRLIVVRQDRFPYSLSSPRHPYALDQYPVEAVGLRPDDPGWRRIPRVDGHPLRVKRALIFHDKLLIWGSFQSSPYESPRDVHLVLDAAGRAQLVRDRQRLNPLAIESSSDSLVSIEERVTIHGGQPREEERPPQSMVFEPLDADGIPRQEGSHRHPIRKLQNLTTDDEGHVYWVRWQAGPTRIAQSRYGNRILEKYSIPEQRVLWSIQLDDVPVQEHHQSLSRIVLAGSDIQFEQDHSIPLDETGRRHQKSWRVQIYDRTDGRSRGHRLAPRPLLDLDRRQELEVGGRRFELRKLGWGASCRALIPLSPASNSLAHHNRS